MCLYFFKKYSQIAYHLCIIIPLSSNNNPTIITSLLNVNMGCYLMKKYVILLFVTIITVISIIFAGNYKKSSIKSVETICLKPTKAENFITCSGKIEYSDTHNIFVQQPSIIKDLCVNVGDKIKKGDMLAYISDAQNIEQDKLESIKNNIPNLKDVYSSFIKNSTNETIKKDQPPNGKDNSVSTLKSPFDGWISSINIKKNSVTNTSSPVLTISGKDTFQIKLCINESRISDICVGQKVIISGVGLKNGEKDGYVKSISNEAKQVINPTGSETVVDVIVGINSQEDNNNDIKPGFTAKCKIVTDEKNDMLIVPYESVKADENGQEYVYKYEKGKAIKNYITTGKEFESGFEVLSGIVDTDKIITLPDSIKDKSFVKLIREECNDNGS